MKQTNSKAQSKKSKRQKAQKPSPTQSLGPDKSLKRKRQAARRAMAPDAVTRSEKFYLSPCSKTYVKAITDPFSLDSGMACVPDLRDYPSQKLMVKARGTFANSTSSGFGYVIAAPLVAFNNTITVITTGTNFGASSHISCDTTAAGIYGHSVTQIPYASGLSSDLKYRTVAAGLRARYIGTELNRGGTLLACRLPIGSSFQGKSFQDIMSINAVQSIPVTRKWTTVFFVPAGDADYEYTSSSTYAINSTDTTQQARLGILCEGNSAASFEWEYVVHKEYFSANPAVASVPNLTASHSDTVGMSAIRNFLEGSIDYLGGPQAFQNALSYVQKYVPTEMSHMATGASVAYHAARAAGYL